MDGNGRTARSLCYLILSLKLGVILPGSPILIEHMAKRREEYYDALIAADATVESDAGPNLKPLSAFVQQLLSRQLNFAPAFTKREESELYSAVRAFISSKLFTNLSSLFDSDAINFRVWSVFDLIVLHVGSKKSLAVAQGMANKHSGPFPGLFSASHQPSLISLDGDHRGAILRPRKFEIGDGAALDLAPNSAVIVERPSVVCSIGGVVRFDWSLDGALYVIRCGDEVSELWMIDVLEYLLSRHVRQREKN